MPNGRRVNLLSAPAERSAAGEGDHWSSRSERTEVEGALGIVAGFTEEANRTARAPSTTLLRRVVPLPRYRGAG